MPGRKELMFQIIGILLLTLMCQACLVESACYNDIDCSRDQYCAIGANARNGKCMEFCKNDIDCHPGTICDKISRKCIKADCQDNLDCPDGFECKDHFCVGKEVFRCPEDMVSIEDQFCIDIYEASRSDATIDNPGTDNLAAQSKPGVLPWLVESNLAAQQACENVGKTLCTQNQWQQACRGPDGHTYSYGDDYSPEICNGIDKYCFCGAGAACESRDPCPFPHCYHECGAQFRLDPTGANTGCTNAYSVFDMNGNVWEHVLGGDNTRIRGGAFNCSNSERLHRCDYIPTTWEPSARGFRCCSAGIRSTQGQSDGGVDGSEGG